MRYLCCNTGESRILSVFLYFHWCTHLCIEGKENFHNEWTCQKIITDTVHHPLSPLIWYFLYVFAAVFKLQNPFLQSRIFHYKTLIPPSNHFHFFDFWPAQRRTAVRCFPVTIPPHSHGGSSHFSETTMHTFTSPDDESSSLSRSAHAALISNDTATSGSFPIEALSAQLIEDSRTRFVPCESCLFFGLAFGCGCLWCRLWISTWDVDLRRVIFDVVWF